MTDTLIEQIMRGMPENWNSDDAPEHVVVTYVRELERRVQALGGNLDQNAGPTDARARFNTAAAKHVTTEDTDDWNNMVNAWNAYVDAEAAER